MTREVIADLHSHSTASDGEYTPTNLVLAARDLGLKALALTDHDTIDGLDEAQTAGRQAGVQIVPGVEVTLRFRRPLFVGSLHLLCYFSETLLNNAEFRKMLQDTLSHGRGIRLVQARVTAINAEFGPQGHQPLLKRPLAVEEVVAYSSNVTRRHFALALQEQHGLEDREQINMLIGNDSPAYIPSGIEMTHLQPLLRQFPLVRVFAHPAAGSFPPPSHYREVLPPVGIVEQLLPELLNPDMLGLDGLEVYYPGHTPEHRELVLGWTQEYGLLVTGGSDCHDTVNRPLGVDGVTQIELEALLTRLGE